MQDRSAAQRQGDRRVMTHPKACHVGGADEHEQLLAPGEEDGEAREARIDIELVNARLCGWGRSGVSVWRRGG